MNPATTPAEPAPCSSQGQALAKAGGEIWLRLLAAEPVLQFFAHAHLPPHLAEISRPFALFAEGLAHDLPPNPERRLALRKLLEARDAALRSRLYVAPDSMAARPAASGLEPA